MWKEIAYMLIKYVVLPNYNPKEDLIESGVGASFAPVNNFLKKQSESIDVKLKSRFSKDQIKAIKIILSKSDDRLLPTSPGSIYEHNANQLEIAEMIVNSYTERWERPAEKGELNGIKQSLDPIFLGNENEKKQIINGIAVVISSVINIALQSPEYLQILTQEIKKAEKAIEKTTRYLYAQNLKYSQLSDKLSCIQSDFNNQEDISSYYDNVIKDFTEKKDDRSSTLLGNMSDNESYIDAFIQVRIQPRPVLAYLSEWFESKEYGTILIYGEPGQGKSLLCKKAIVEYKRGDFLNRRACNVLAVSLNLGDNPGIISNGIVNYENMLAWGPISEHHFSFEDCRGSMLFMDGFDEFIDEAMAAGIPDILSFMNKVDQIAKAYSIHIVILSRRIAIQKYLNDLQLQHRSFALLPITKEQQNQWLDKHVNSTYYRRKFKELQNDKDMQELLGIPLLFRMIVHSRFDKVSSNEVELYDNLFEHLMNKRNLSRKKIQIVRNGLMALAYNIYCTDTDTAVLKEEEMDPHWVFAFFLKAPDNQNRLGFYHRSFYQYFLAKYIVFGLQNLTKENAELYMGYFAERELDETIRKYLSLMIKSDNRIALHNGMRTVMDALVETQAIIHFLPETIKGDAEKTALGRATNIYRNMMFIAAALKYVIQLPAKNGLDFLIVTYNSVAIPMHSSNIKVDLQGTNLSSANLSHSDLRKANMIGVILHNTNISDADLSEADLTGASLYKTDLQRTNLRGAILTKAKLIGTDLAYANLDGAHLESVHMNRVVLEGNNLRRANLESAFMTGANLKRSKLNRANLHEAKLRESILSKADLQEANLNRASLDKANLSEANLENADLSNTEMRESILCSANLCDAKLCNANLSYANLEKACLGGADLERANLGNTNLKGANLRGANLQFADLRGANLSGASLCGPIYCRNQNSATSVIKEINISFAKIDLKYKNEISSNIQGYTTIEWNAN